MGGAAMRCSGPTASPANSAVEAEANGFLGLLSALRAEHERLEARIEALVAENSRLRIDAPGTRAQDGGYENPAPKLRLTAERAQGFESLGVVWRDDAAEGAEAPVPPRGGDGVSVAWTQSIDRQSVATSEPPPHRRTVAARNCRGSMHRRSMTRVRSARATAGRVQKLHRWFARVDHAGLGVLTRRQLLNIYRRVNGPEESIPPGLLDRLLTALDEPEIFEYVLDGDGLWECDRLEDVRLCRSTAQVMEDTGTLGMPTMAFRAFATLIVWEGLIDRVPDELVGIAAVLRDALVKHSADVLVAHYAHLKVYDPEDLKGPPSAMVALDSASGLAIIANAISIGLTSDYPDLAFLHHLELFFVAVFLVELLGRMWFSGCRRYFTGPDMGWNFFDSAVVFLSLIDAAAYIYEGADTGALDNKKLGPISLIRLARLARLTRLMRLVRVLRLRLFKELVLMAKGVVAGMRTLIWAIVLFVFIIYSGAVFMRQTAGQDRIAINDAYGTVLFSDVPWSMFMIFRILMQDGALPDGTPVAGRMYELYGVAFMIPYMLCLLFTVFGVFNLMTALFVENVLEAAKQKKQLSVVQERVRVAQKLRELVLKFTGQRVIETPGFIDRLRMWWLLNPLSVYDSATSRPSDFHIDFQRTSMAFEIEGSITRQMFNDAMRDPRVHMLLNDLEVQMSDRTELFDVLDADGSGEIDIAELIPGLIKLRSGGADKSDTVATVLGIRAIQARVRTMESSLLQIADAVAPPEDDASSSGRRSGGRARCSLASA